MKLSVAAAPSVKKAHSLFGNTTGAHRVLDGSPLTAEDVMSCAWQSLFGGAIGIITTLVMKLSSLVSLQIPFGNATGGARHRVLDGSPLTAEDVMSFAWQSLFGVTGGATTVRPEGDPFGPSKGLSFVPFVGEVCLLAGIFVLTYVGCEGWGTILMVPMGHLVVGGGVALVLVAMICMWYTQWIYGAYAREVSKMMVVVRRRETIHRSINQQTCTNNNATLETEVTEVKGQANHDNSMPFPSPPSQQKTSVVTSPLATHLLPVPPVAAPPVIVSKKTPAAADITSIAEIDNFISPFMSPTITPFISPTITPSPTRRNSLTAGTGMIVNRSSEDSNPSETEPSKEAATCLDEIPSEHCDDTEHQVQPPLVQVQSLEQQRILESSAVSSLPEATAPLWVHLRVLLFFTAGWVWTIVSISLLLPLFSMPFYHSMGGSPLTRSMLIGPLVRALQGYLTQR